MICRFIHNLSQSIFKTFHWLRWVRKNYICTAVSTSFLSGRIRFERKYSNKKYVVPNGYMAGGFNPGVAKSLDNLHNIIKILRDIANVQCIRCVMCFQHAQLKACTMIFKSYMSLLSWGLRVFLTSIRGVVWCNSWKTPGIWYSRTSLVRTGVICIAKDLKETEVVFVII